MGTSDSKIFGIGLSKTGTSSLAHALEILGFRTKDYLGVVRYAPGDLSSIDLDIIDENDAFTDTPIPSFYRELDAKYPHSKFILTVREREHWLRSCKKQFTQRLAEKQNEANKCLFMDLYGTDVFDEKKFADGYEKFVSGALEYFTDRPNDLLVIDIAAGDGWEKLCKFLGRPVPEMPFPKANVTQVRWIDIGDVVAIARMAGEEILNVCKHENRARKRNEGSRLAEDAAKSDLLNLTRKIVEKVVYSMSGGYEAALRRTRKRAHKVIVTQLGRLTPQIPVLSAFSNSVSYSERAKWNHFWLVDSLSGSSEFLGSKKTFTVNIALVEDGRPIYGVVYAPGSDTVYYAKAGLGSFKIESGATPQKLASFGYPNTQASPETEEYLGNIHAEHCGETTSHALSMCHVAEGKAGPYRCTERSMEWETAAAHAIVRSVGKAVYDCDSRKELTYNKRDLTNGCFTVE